MKPVITFLRKMTDKFFAYLAWHVGFDPDEKDPKVYNTLWYKLFFKSYYEAIPRLNPWSIYYKDKYDRLIGENL